MNESLKPIYTTIVRELTLDVASQWLARFLSALSAPACSGLDDFFHANQTGAGPHYQFLPANHITDVLRAWIADSSRIVRFTF